MDKKTVFIKTPKGESEISRLSGDMKRVILLVYGRLKLEAVIKHAPPSLRGDLPEILQRLLDAELIRDKDKQVAAPKITAPRVVVPKMASPQKEAELDFTTMFAAPSPAAMAEEAAKHKARLEAEAKARQEAEAKAKHAAEAARARAELEAAVAAAKLKAIAESEEKAQAKARLEAGIAARSKQEADANANRVETTQKPSHGETDAQALLRAKVEAAERSRKAELAAHENEGNIGVSTAPTQEAKVLAEQKARQEVEAKAFAEQKAKQAAEAAERAKVEEVRIKAEQEAFERARVEAEARARAEREAIENARREAEEAARIKAEQEAARIKTEQEALERARVEAEASARAEREAAEKARRAEEEVARIKAEQEAARLKAELEAAARAKAEAEAARVKAEAEAARVKAEAEAARVKAEAEAARVKAEAEAARVKAEAEAARVKAEQESARIRAEAEAQRIKAEQEVARMRAEAEAKVIAEQKARQEAAAKLKTEQEAAARLQAEREAEERAKAEAASNKSQGMTDGQASLRAKVEEAERSRKAELAAHANEGQEEKSGAAAVPTQEGKAVSTPFQIDLGNLNLGTHQVAVPAESKLPEPEPVVVPQVQPEEDRPVVKEPKVEKPHPFQNVAEEMERLKAEQEANRLRAEQEARKQEEEKVLAAEQADAWAEAEQRSKLQAKLESEQASQQAVFMQAKAATKSAPRAPHNPLPIGKILFSLIFLALLAVVVLPYVWPLQEYVAGVEQRISGQLKQPVHIGGMSASTFPPKLQFQNVTVGNAQEVKFTTVTLNFDPASLFSDIKVISNAELQGITLDGKSLDQIALWLKGMGGDAQFPVRHLSIQSLQVNAEGISIPPLKGKADLEQGAFTRVVLYSEDSKVQVDLQPLQNRWQLSFGIKERALPLFPDVVFSDFNVKGEIGDGEVNFTELDAHAYGGILAGSAKLNWRKGWQLQGRIQAKTMELDKMFKQFGLAGEIFADGTFSAQSLKLTQLGDSPKLEGSFEAKKGVINGIDMVETARLASHEHLGRGRTNFDSMTGTLILENHIRRFRQIKINSGMLSASGSFDVNANNQLSGSFNSEIKARAGNSPLVLSGTTSEPQLVAR